MNNIELKFYNYSYADISKCIFNYNFSFIKSIIEIKINNKIIYCYTLFGLFLRILSIINDGALIIKYSNLSFKTISYIHNNKKYNYYILKNLDIGFIKPNLNSLLSEIIHLSNIFDINFCLKIISHNTIFTINNNPPTVIII